MVCKFATIFLCTVVLYSKISTAQVQTDTELWTGGKVNIKLKKRLTFEPKYQFRSDNNLSQKKHNFYQFGVRMKIKKWFYFKPSYRLVRTGNVNKDRNRFTTDFTFKVNPKGPLRFENRLRYQYHTVINTAERGHFLRNRLSIGYNLGKLVDPELAGELFMRQFEDFSDFRLKFGLNWKINQKVELNTFYAYEQQLGRKSNDRINIIGILANYNIKVKKQKKKENEG